MDENVRQTNLLLRETDARVKQCLGCAHEGTVVTDSDGMIIEASQPTERILETAANDLISKSIHVEEMTNAVSRGSSA